MALQSEYPHLVQIMEPQMILSVMSQDFVSQRGHFCSPLSRNFVSRLGHVVLESMPRTIRSTPIPPAEAVPTVGTAPVSASPLTMPDPNPSRALAFFVDPQTQLEATRILVYHVLDLLLFSTSPPSRSIVLRSTEHPSVGRQWVQGVSQGQGQARQECG